MYVYSFVRKFLLILCVHLCVIHKPQTMVESGAFLMPRNNYRNGFKQIISEGGET